MAIPRAPASTAIKLRKAAACSPAIMPQLTYSGPSGANAITPRPIDKGNDTTVAVAPAVALRKGSFDQPSGTDENSQAGVLAAVR